MRYALLLLAACLCAPARAALVYQATLQDDAASTTVVAATGTNGTLVGGDNTADISEDAGPGGSYTKALHFDDTADHVDVGTDANFPSGSDVRTVCFWVNVDTFDTETDDAIVGYCTSTTGRSFNVYAEDNAIAVGFNGHRIISTTTALSTGTWYHVAIVVPSGATTTADVDVYINGNIQSLNDEAGSSQTLNTSTPDVLVAASRASSPFSFFDGYVADFRIYDTDESANLAAIMADGQDTGSPLLLLLLTSVVFTTSLIYFVRRSQCVTS